ncbi:MAG: hypothetical protein WCI71_14325, partial [Bacteroidota bacterium]
MRAMSLIFIFLQFTNLILIGQEKEIKITKADRVFVKAYNIDDIGECYINNKLILSVAYNPGYCDWKEITSYLTETINKIKFKGINNAGCCGFSYGFQIKINSKISWEETKSWQSSEAGVLYNKDITIVSEITPIKGIKIFSADGKITETDNNLPISETVILKDNFERGSINTTLWEVTGVHVKQEDGIMKLEQNVTDQPTCLSSKWLAFDTRRSIKITRNVKIHRGGGQSNNYYYGSFGLTFDNENSMSIQYLYSKYNDRKYTPLKEGIFLQTTYDKNYTEKRLASNIWDEWFKETFIFKAATGVISYYLNDLLITSFKTEVILSGNNHLKLIYSPAGWWTGHYQYMDNLEVTYDGTGLPVITWITPGSSFVETSDLPYTIKASIKSEKQIQSVKVMSGDSTVASENTVPLINGQNTFEKNIELYPGSNEISIIAENEYGQTVSAKRTVQYDEPQAPPLLLLSDIIFTDQNSNNRIDGNEECYIKFSVSNKGKGPAHNLTVMLRNNSDIKGLSFNSLTTLGSISQNAQQNVIIPISGLMDLTTGIFNLNISFEEKRGFPPDPVDMQIETKAFVKPDIRIVDYSFLTDNGSIKLGYPIQLKVLVQNVGQGIGDNVSVKFQYPGQNVFLNGPKDFLIGTMQPGSTKELVFEFIPNKLYTETNIPITVKISEKYGKFSQERLVSAIVAAKSAGNTIAVKSNTSENIVNIEVASLSADV